MCKYFPSYNTKIPTAIWILNAQSSRIRPVRYYLSWTGQSGEEFTRGWVYVHYYTTTTPWVERGGQTKRWGCQRLRIHSLNTQPPPRPSTDPPPNTHTPPPPYTKPFISAKYMGLRRFQDCAIYSKHLQFTYTYTDIYGYCTSYYPFGTNLRICPYSFSLFSVYINTISMFSFHFSLTLSVHFAY